MDIVGNKKYQLTIISSCYNSESYLDGFFNNITKMDGFQNFLLLIYLNSPTPIELNIAAKFKNLYPDNIVYEVVKREFVSQSTNRGLKKACTDYVVYADVDDRRFHDAYIRMIHTLDNNLDCDLTYGDYLYVSKPDVFTGKLHKTNEFDIESFTRFPQIGPGHFFRKSILDKVGFWDEQLKSGADFDYQIRAAFNVKFKKTGGNPITYYTYNTNGVSLSSGDLSKIEAMVISLRYGIYSEVPRWLYYIPEIYKYRISHVSIDDKWESISNYVTDIESILSLRMQNLKNERIKLSKENYYISKLRSELFKTINPSWNSK
jgi:hypothetical protein